jgi:hypothetical protein
MQGMNENEFDAFFQKAAENLEVPYNAKAWDKMQAKLRTSAGGGADALRKWFIGFGLLALVPLLWWSVSNWHADETTQPPLVVINTVQQSADKQELPVQPSPELSAAETFTRQHISPGVSPSAGNNAKDKSLASVSGMAEPEEKMVLQAIEVLISSRLPSVRHLANAGISGQTILLTLPGNDIRALQEEKEIIVGKTGSKDHRWGISAGLSPDLSGVGFRHINDISSKASLQLEYFVGPNLSISSGAIFTNMLYEASPEDYRRTMSYRPDWVNAQCRVLEIPLNLRWYAFGNAKQRFFVSGGLSSYLMLTEDYEYVYKSTEKGTYTRNWGVKNENNHLFKVASLSVGYERSLGKKWALQAEPFVRLPLAGVGAGQVRLSTLGMFMSVHYRWGRR